MTAPFTPAQLTAAREAMSRRGMPAHGADVVLRVLAPDMVELHERMAATAEQLADFKARYEDVARWLGDDLTFDHAAHGGRRRTP